MISTFFFNSKYLNTFLSTVFWSAFIYFLATIGLTFLAWAFAFMFLINIGWFLLFLNNVNMFDTYHKKFIALTNTPYNPNLGQLLKNVSHPFEIVSFKILASK